MVVQRIPVFAVLLAVRYAGKVYADMNGVQFHKQPVARAYGRNNGFGLGQGKGYKNGR
jgi:hypothetical protein